jgi:hypothetical protein
MAWNAIAFSIGTVQRKPECVWVRLFWNDAPDHPIIGFVQSPSGIAELYSASFHSRAARDYLGRFIRAENRLQTAWSSIEDNPVAAELVPAVQTRSWGQHPPGGKSE